MLSQAAGACVLLIGVDDISWESIATGNAVIRSDMLAGLQSCVETILVNDFSIQVCMRTLVL